MKASLVVDKILEGDGDISPEDLVYGARNIDLETILLCKFVPEAFKEAVRNGGDHYATNLRVDFPMPSWPVKRGQHPSWSALYFTPEWIVRGGQVDFRLVRSGFASGASYSTQAALGTPDYDELKSRWLVDRLREAEIAYCQDVINTGQDPLRQFDGVGSVLIQQAENEIEVIKEEALHYPGRVPIWDLTYLPLAGPDLDDDAS